MKWLAIFVLALSCSAEDQQFIIGGVVVDAGSRNPLARVRVVISSTSRRTVEVSGNVTTGDGKFRFSVPQGKYTLRAERNGLPAQTFGVDDSRTSPGISIITGA